MRRKFYDFQQATGSPIAAEALRRIAEIYVIEGRIRGRPPEARQRARQAESKPLLEAMKTWLETELGRISAKSALAGAIGMRCGTGKGSACSSRTAASRPIPTPSSAPSDRSSSAAKTTCSPAPTAAPKAGRPLPR